MESNHTTECTGSLSADILADLKSIKLIVIVDDLKLLTMADEIAEYGPLNRQRKVVWVKKPDLTAIKKQINGVDAINNWVAFSVSPINKFAFAITKTTTIDELKIEEAFVKAGKTINQKS